MEPSIARVYDYLLGGKDNYAVDQQVGDHFKVNLPGSVDIAVSNRRALVRAVREMSAAGIRQFVDLGSGLPTADNVHQVAQRSAADARVVYVDSDPIVLAHGRALLETNGTTTVIEADVREPEAIRRHPEVVELIDFTEPVGVIFSAILHHLNDDEDPAGVVRFWTDEVVPESLVFISHFRSGGNAETIAAEQALQATFGRGRWRSDVEILALFGDAVQVLEPGVVPAARWRPTVTHAGSGDEPNLTVWERLIAAGLGRKR